jgi:hypothetical protein
MRNLFMECGAQLSACGRYRYTLQRTWERSLPALCFVMLNPSTANASEDDPTIRRCIGLAQDRDFGGIVVVNLFAFRATDPRDLFAAAEPIGPGNDVAIVEATEGRKVLCAWGAHGGHLTRDEKVIDLLRSNARELFCYGLTRHGKPKHPLYLPANVELQPFGT